MKNIMMMGGQGFVIQNANGYLFMKTLANNHGDAWTIFLNGDDMLKNGYEQRGYSATKIQTNLARSPDQK